MSFRIWKYESAARRVLSACAAVLVLGACQPDDSPVTTSPYDIPTGLNNGQFRYDIEYPTMAYSDDPTANRVARLMARLADGSARLQYSAERGYLDSLLVALDIDPASQMLVFSKTSLQVDGVTPQTPRAIFFNDDTYVASVQGADLLEIAAMDSKLGPVFYTLAQSAPAERAIERRLTLCLRCHDSYSMTGGGVPRFITGSGYIGLDGSLVSHEGWILTSYKTPLRNRWGGWYVSGRHAGQVHLGNFAVAEVDELYRLDEHRIGNLDSVAGLVDVAPYPTPYSDIVALLVLEQQTTIQNVMTRVHYDVRNLLDTAPAEATVERIAELSEPLVEALLFVDEAALEGPIVGTSGFTEVFAQPGPRDARGRSLRTLNLEQRLFEYPLSYLIYSDAFAALPTQVKDFVYRRLDTILSGADQSARFAHLRLPMRTAIREILLQTHPEFVAQTASAAGED